jgi:xanthine dehydrogenase YagT iron-sulfur-binding subunit
MTRSKRRETRQPMRPASDDELVPSRDPIIEALSNGDDLHPLQEAFWDHDAYQYGYCTAGLIMSAAAMLNDPTIGTDDASVRKAMGLNLCGEGAFRNILAAIESARRTMEGAT